jgi:hypothetical protein
MPITWVAVMNATAPLLLYPKGTPIVCAIMIARILGPTISANYFGIAL